MPVLILKAALVAVMIAIIREDLKAYRIPNSHVLVALALTLTILLMTGTIAELLPHLLIAAVVFPFLVLAYAKGAMGGGDAKLIAVALLWTGPELSLLFSLALLVLILSYWVAVRFGLAPFQRLDGRTHVPFGPSIAGAWIITIIASAIA